MMIGLRQAKYCVHRQSHKISLYKKYNQVHVYTVSICSWSTTSTHRKTLKTSRATLINFKEFRSSLWMQHVCGFALYYIRTYHYTPIGIQTIDVSKLLKQQPQFFFPGKNAFLVRFIPWYALQRSRSHTCHYFRLLHPVSIVICMYLSPLQER